MSGQNKYKGYPFSPELCAFMDTYPEFEASLKLANPDRFECLQPIILSRLPEYEPFSDDEVIGIWYLDKSNFQSGTSPFFKQDYIVNPGKRNEEFVSFSTNNDNGSFVRPLSEFFQKYSPNEIYYRHPSPPNLDRWWAHHYNDVEDLPEPLQEAGRAAKKRVLSTS